MSDLISRQAAIEVIDAVFPVNPTKSEYAQGLACGVALAKTYVEQLPSVQPEPKTGKWIKVYGFATPGGDPVWRCSECGKGLHVYGIEAYGADIAEHQWVSCPNCGADMREEEQDD